MENVLFDIFTGGLILMCVGCLLWLALQIVAYVLRMVGSTEGIAANVNTGAAAPAPAAM